MKTTVNNLTIEQMREIVEGAPDKTADTYCVGDWGIAYFSLEFKSVWCAEDKDWFDSDYETIEELGCDYKIVIALDDLRTAIAEHDSREFKAGDWVVKIRGNDHRLYVFPIQNIANPKCCYIDEAYKNRSEYISIINIRHATPDEIKAGHRIDTPNCEVRG
ncbi:hypothetical protein [Acinetobacter gerneri]|uniref:hypothetical protein n=1 Tax=Acinetobacter gerneri TaxID=202952 RepID=UPI0028AFF06A|nr:hypothetical protein [Acinetobacter gerneri]